MICKLSAKSESFFSQNINFNDVYYKYKEFKAVMLFISLKLFCMRRGLLYKC